MSRPHRDPLERLAERCTYEDRGYETLCLTAKSSRADGYARISAGGRGGRKLLAHRFIWEHFNGPVPEGLELDHLCRQRDCCELTHLEAVTHRENVLRGISPSARQARQTHCKYGHEFTQSSSNGGRRCAICAVEHNRQYRARQRSLA